MLTHENVTLGIAIAGFVLSSWNAISAFLKNRKKLTIEFQDVFSSTPQPGETREILNLHIVNGSREPITLSGLKISCDGRENSFGEYRHQVLLIGNTFGGQELRREQWYSKIFPIKLEGLGGIHILLTSSGNEPAIKTGVPCCARFSTNKGHLSMKFTINDFSNPKLLEQCQVPDLSTQSLK